MPSRNMEHNYKFAKEYYATIGVDTDAALKKLAAIRFRFIAGRATTSADLNRMPEEPPAAFSPPATIPDAPGTRRSSAATSTRPFPSFPA